MKPTKSLLALALLASATTTGTAQASLFDRGNGLIYDSTQNITWTANSNINGSMTWASAFAWANNLVLGGFSDWRLPTTNPAVSGSNQTGSEMGHLFYVDLGGTYGYSIITTHTNAANYNLFTNIQANNYWSGTSSNGGLYAWEFQTYNGDQNIAFKDFNLFPAWAVRSGDITAVPVPTAFWLFGSGLVGLIGFKRSGNIV